VDDQLLKLNDFKTITLEINNKIATLTLNRPESLNAINLALARELDEATGYLQNNSNNIRVLVITGAGRAFCVGGDVKEMEIATPEHNQEELMRANQAIYKIANLDFPVISAINGHAIGAGLNLAMAGDILVASKRAKFSQAFVNVGLVPDLGGTYFLPRLIGFAKAKEMIFSGETIDALEAKNIGLINKVVDDEDFLMEIEKEAKKYSQKPTKALSISKKLLNTCYDRDLKTSLDYEQVYCSMAAQTEDHKEGVLAFIEKRKPNFTGN
jgi:2-(1,2-epoxy-1,2-dihydrophenyl)acetyl-CoA isomerase